MLEKGYYRSDLADINNAIGPEMGASINIDQIYGNTQNEGRIRQIRKAFNVERQALEASELRTIISENNALSYLRNKKYFIRDRWNVITTINQ